MRRVALLLMVPMLGCSLIFGGAEPSGDTDAPDGQCGDCPTDAPFCSNGSCLRCDETAPTVDGQNLECLDQDEQTPFCSGFRCVECTSHSECGSEACDIRNGICLAEEEVLYVDPSTPTPGIDCGKDSRCTTLKLAIDEIQRANNGPRIIVIALGSDLTESVSMTGALVGTAPIRIIGYGASLTGAPADDEDTIDLNGPINIFIEGLRVSLPGIGTRNEGIGCFADAPGATLEIYDAIVENHSAAGISVADCTLHLERSQVRDNPGGGILVDGSDSAILHSLVTNNGSADSPLGGIRYLDNASTVDLVLEFTTVANNQSDGSEASGVDCGANASVRAKAVIVWSDVSGTTVDGPCAFDHSNVRLDGAQAAAGMDNINTDPLFAVGGFALTQQSPGQGIDVLKLDPLTTDAAGVLRPTNGPGMGGLEFVP